MNQCIHNIDLLRWLMSGDASSSNSKGAGSNGIGSSGGVVASSNAAASAGVLATDIHTTTADITLWARKVKFIRRSKIRMRGKKRLDKTYTHCVYHSQHQDYNYHQHQHQRNLLSHHLMPLPTSSRFSLTQTDYPPPRREDLILALVRFTNGAYGLIEGITNIYPRNLEETLYLFGEHGTKLEELPIIL